MCAGNLGGQWTLLASVAQASKNQNLATSGKASQWQISGPHGWGSCFTRMMFWAAREVCLDTRPFTSSQGALGPRAAVFACCDKCPALSSSRAQGPTPASEVQLNPRPAEKKHIIPLSGFQVQRNSVVNFQGLADVQEKRRFIPLSGVNGVNDQGNVVANFKGIAVVEVLGA